MSYYLNTEPDVVTLRFWSLQVTCPAVPGTCLDVRMTRTWMSGQSTAPWSVTHCPACFDRTLTNHRHKHASLRPLSLSNWGINQSGYHRVTQLEKSFKRRLHSSSSALTLAILSVLTVLSVPRFGTRYAVPRPLTKLIWQLHRRIWRSVSVLSSHRLCKVFFYLTNEYRAITVAF